jgi:hypothetical protein
VTHHELDILLVSFFAITVCRFFARHVLASDLLAVLWECVLYEVRRVRVHGQAETESAAAIPASASSTTA